MQVVKSNTCPKCGLYYNPIIEGSIPVNQCRCKPDAYWEDTFDKVLITKSLPNGYRELCGDEVNIVTVMKLKNFIAKLLDSELSKLEDKNSEIWEDGYSFGLYKVKEIIAEIMEDGKVAYHKELDILKDKIDSLKRP